MTFRLGVLGSADSWYMHDLRRASLTLELDIVQLNFETLQIATWDGKNRITASTTADALGGSHVDLQPGGPPGRDVDLSDLDAVLVRTMPLGSLEQIIFRMDALHLYQQQGGKIFNSPRSLECAIDKCLSLGRLQGSGIPVPTTITCQTRQQALKAFDDLGKDVVVKPIFGGEGRGILRVDNADLAWRVFGTLEQLGSVLYVQQFIPHMGYDLRILLIGNDAYGVRRESMSDWRTNVSRGAIATSYQPTSRQLQLAREAAAATQGSIVGVDLLPCENGDLFVLEVNAVPGWKATAAALNLDVAAKVLQFVIGKSKTQ